MKEMERRKARVLKNKAVSSPFSHREEPVERVWIYC